MARSLSSDRAGNKTLSKAKNAKQDEFYTQLPDIENELRHYRAQLRDKVVLCNCDDPYESNFFRYFALNFNALGIKKLITTCYDGSSIAGGRLPLLDIEGLKPEGKQPYAVEITNVPDANGDGAIDLTDVELLLKSDGNVSHTLNGDFEYGAGDFRSEECVEFLKQADVVVTNPPFSLFREYLDQLISNRKQFLIIGNKNALHYQDVFRLIKENLLWLGRGFAAGNAYFSIPAEMGRDFANGVYDPVTGLVKFRNVGWFTNMDHAGRHEQLPLFRRYDPTEYPHYDNYDAIEVSKIANIPCDYDGLMGVPDTFFDVYNPDQFEVVGIPFGNMGKELGVKRNYRGRTDIALTDSDGKSRCPYSRIIVRRK